MERLASVCILALIIACSAVAQDLSNTRQDGYRGIWYFIAQKDEYKYKYSGGLGTYCADHVPMAVYAPQVNKTFFVFGGTKGLDQPKPLLEMAGCYDHNTGTVCKPTVIMEKGTGDAHHNPTLTIDKDGYLWVFCAAHGGKDAFIYKSRKPYSTDGFDRVLQKEFSYPQSWYFDDVGLVLLFTKYTRGRELYISTSRDGINWTEDRKYAGFDGHYQVAWPCGKRIGSTFNWHPGGNLDARTNLYYMETPDFGRTWTNAAGKTLDVPLSDHQNDALVHDYRAEGWRVYINDLNYDKDGRPVIFYNLSKGFESGPKNGMKPMMIAHFTGKEWEFSKIGETDHNYDMGSLYIEDDGTWRIIAPTGPGPQPWLTGGEMWMWLSKDQGRTWTKVRELTAGSPRNHTYARRPVNANPSFYAFWADGNASEPSDSMLYFCNKAGNRVNVMPSKMTNDNEKPKQLLKKRGVME